jgi:hypothetical protein
MIKHFSDKSLSDFKECKNFLQFYQSLTKMKSDKSNTVLPNSIKYNGNIINGKQNVCDAFSNFFSSLSPIIQATANESERFISNHFEKLKIHQHWIPKHFHFIPFLKK